MCCAVIVGVDINKSSCDASKVAGARRINIQEWRSGRWTSCRESCWRYSTAQPILLFDLKLRATFEKPVSGKVKRVKLAGDTQQTISLMQNIAS